MLEIKNVTICYQDCPAVKNFSMTVEQGKIAALAGESGSGKTTVIRAVLGLLANGGRVTEGDILFEGKSLLKNTPGQWRKLRGTAIAMIFQDSGAMLNPTRKIGAVFVEYIRTHEKISRADAWKKGAAMLERMRLPGGDAIMNAYPFQLSGGMRQRVGIAMAMAFRPRLLLAQIVRQMMELREEYGTSIVLVTHNLGVAAYMSDWIVVMKGGGIAGSGNRNEILSGNSGGYIQKLLDAVPTLGGARYV